MRILLHFGESSFQHDAAFCAVADLSPGCSPLRPLRLCGESQAPGQQPGNHGRGFLAKAPSSPRTVPNEERFVVLLVWLRRSE